MAEKPSEKSKAEKSGGGMKTIILIAVGALILVAGAVGGTLYFTGVLSKDPGDAAGHAAPVAHAPPPPVLGPPVYLPVKPAFVVNVVDPRQVRFMQVEVALMARNPEAINGINEHMVALKNDLREVLSGRPLDGVVTRVGIEQLRTEALAAANQCLQQRHAPPLDALYFTSFIVQ